MGVCNFLDSVSSQQKFEAMDVKALGQTVSQLLDRSVLQLRVTAQFYLENKRKIQPRSVRACRPKKHEEEREGACDREGVREVAGPLAPFFMFFLLPLGLPCVNWASQECCLFYLRSSLWSWDLPVLFSQAFPLSFSHHHSGLLFPILTT